MYTFNVNQQQLQMIVNALSTYSENFKGLGEGLLRSAIAQEATKREEEVTTEVKDENTSEDGVVETQNQNEQQ